MSSPRPLVSVVIPTRNRSRLLAMTARSALRQRHTNLEVVIVDEASTDNTPEVIGRLTDARIRVVRHEAPQGVAMARNRGWLESTGEWVAFLDDDDLWAPDKLEAQLRAASATGRDWAYTGAVNIDDDNHIIAGVRPPTPEGVVQRLRGYNAVPGGGSNVIARRSLLDRVGPFDARHYNTEDWEMWLRLAMQGPPASVPSPLLAYRVHTRNASQNIAAILAGAALIERVHGAAIDYGMLYRWFAETSLRQRNRADAVRFLALAAKHGQLRGVAGDLAAIAQRRGARYLRTLGFARTGSLQMDAWTSAAQHWLDELAND